MRNRRFTALFVVAALVAATFAGVQLWGAARYRASADPARTLPARLADARAAYRVMPLWPAYHVRFVTLRGLALFERNDILRAYDVLHAEFVAETVAGKLDPELVRAHALVRDEYLTVSARNAHQLHGRERWDGSVAPQDVQRFPQPETPTPGP